jgi:type I restriction enzyme S subunit
LYYFFYYRYQETRRIGSGNNQKALNKNRISNMTIPLMSTQEQNQIVQEIESRLSVCDKIEETIRNSLTKAEALRQSILKKAFEGNLLNTQELEAIHTHPDYESAEKLLKRIKQERAK